MEVFVYPSHISPQNQLKEIRNIFYLKLFAIFKRDFNLDLNLNSFMCYYFRDN